MLIYVNGDASTIRWAVDLTLRVDVGDDLPITVVVKTTGDSRLAVWVPVYGETNIHIGYVDTILEAEALARAFATRWYSGEIGTP